MRLQTKRQAVMGMAVGAVAITLTGLSLSHLAHGIEMVTRSPAWEAWAMAVGIDLGFVAIELAQLSANKAVVTKMRHYSQPAIFGTLAGSATMNALAFAAEAPTMVMQAGGVALGVAIPALVYALTRIGAAIWIDCHGR